MPLIVFSHPVKSLRISKKMPNPKRLDNLVYWLKLARKTIPEIPTEGPEWRLSQSAATTTKVAFEFVNNQQEYCYVQIDRQTRFFG
jgi:hypothetical protein